MKASNIFSEPQFVNKEITLVRSVFIKFFVTKPFKKMMEKVQTFFPAKNTYIENLIIIPGFSQTL